MKKRHYIPAIFIAIAIVLSLYYAFFRDNEIEVQLDKSRYIINQRIRNIDLERFPLILQLEFERFFRDFKNIQLQKEWTAELSFDLTHTPFFDLRNVYLVSFDKIAVYDKNNMNIIWIKQIDENIESFTLIDGNNILVIDSNGTVYAFNRNSGDLSWSYDLEKPFIGSDDLTPRAFQITNNEDKRLLTSIIVLPIENEIVIFDNMSGEVLFVLELDDYIYFISRYDQIENAFYVSYGNKIAKILLEKS